MSASEDYAWEILFSSAWSYRLADDYERAVAIIRKYSGPLSQYASRWWVAKWYSECGKYEEAAQELKQELEDPLPLPESWLLSSIVALSALVKDEDERAKSFADRLRRDSPETVQLLESIIAEQWPRFEKLEPECRDAWLYAVSLTHLKPAIQGGELHNFRTAIHEYGRILERELKIRIFQPFRERVAKDGALHAKSLKEEQTRPEDILLSYIHGKQSSLTLGNMVKVIEDALPSRNETEEALLRWLKKRFPNIHASISSMKKLNSEWRRAKHESPLYQRTDVIRIQCLCKEALAWL